MQTLKNVASSPKTGRSPGKKPTHIYICAEKMRSERT